MEVPVDFAEKGKSKQILLQPASLVSEPSSYEIKHRDEQIKALSNAINSIKITGIPDNLFVYGPSGSGKTVCVRYLLSTSDNWYKVVPVYVDCHEYTTKTALFNKIAFELGNPVSRRGFASYEVFEHIKDLLNKEGRTVLLILDNFDSIQNGESFEVIYSLLGANDGGRALFAVIAIADNLEVIDRMDEKIKNTLMFRAINFEPYNKNQIEVILEATVRRFLSPNSIEVGVLSRIAEFGESEGGNARFATWLLFSAARRAEQRGEGKVIVEDVDSVYRDLAPLRSIVSDSDYPGLTKEELLIVGILKIGEKSSSEIYDLFQKNIDLSKRQVRNYLTSLEKKGIIESEIVEDSASILKPKIFRLTGEM